MQVILYATGCDDHHDVYDDDDLASGGGGKGDQHIPGMRRYKSVLVRNGFGPGVGMVLCFALLCF